MSESSSSHAASHERLRRTKQAIVLAIAGATATVWALVATNSVGVTATSVAADPNANGIAPAPPQVQPDQQQDDGFFGAPNDQPGFFGQDGGNGGGSFSGNGGFGNGGFGNGNGPMMRSGGS